jgi:hypothetical protein
MPLESARLKLQRAEDHMVEFNRRMAEFRATDPWHVIRDLEGDGVEHLYRVEIRAEPPPYLGTIIGDFFHNVRSAFDSIAYDLSMTSTPLPSKKQQRRIGFPFSRTQKSFEDAISKQLRFVARKAQKEINRLQPYLSWDPSWGDQPHDLLTIGDANNIDKHRFVHPVPAFPFTFMWTRPHGVPDPTQEIIVPSGSLLTSGQELARFVFEEPQQVDLNFHPSIDVTFDGKEVASLQLKRLLELVRDKIVPRFEQFV